MTDVQVLKPPLDDEARGDRVHAGAVLVFSDVPEMHALVAATDARLRAAFDAADPIPAIAALAPDDAARRVDAAQKAYRKDPEIRALFTALFAALGADVARTYGDACHLRALPSGDGHGARQTRALFPHRDSWASNLYAQTNWWAPVYPIVPERGLALFPRHWAEPIANTSGEWDIERAKAARAADKGAGAGAAAYPLLPSPTDEVDWSTALRLAVMPGDVVCFSGAQLHASVPNRTGVARFSVETRTVFAGDVEAGRGAPNIDGGATHVAWGWFRRMTDGTPLTPPSDGAVGAAGPPA